MLTGNKGEWGEAYALLKLLADKRLVSGGKDSNRADASVFPIVKIIRSGNGGSHTYSFDGNETVVIATPFRTYNVRAEEFGRQAENLLAHIKKSTGRAFPVPETEKFLASFACTKIKADSMDKSDIHIVIHDTRAGTTSDLGFSIKSQFGQSATLLNPGSSTNFIYKIAGDGIGPVQKEKINAIKTRSKIRDRIRALSALKNKLVFAGTENHVFEGNMVLIDSRLPEIVAEMLLVYYSEGISDVRALVAGLSGANPLRYRTGGGQPFYSYKIKRFLTDIALGMTPAHSWTGRLDATGGDLVVKADGEIVCHHIYDRNEFEDYLFHGTRLDTPDSSRHGFGVVYEDGGEFFFKLNLQIRYKHNP
jgi:type II restriction enzyme